MQPGQQPLRQIALHPKLRRHRRHRHQLDRLRADIADTRPSQHRHRSLGGSSRNNNSTPSLGNRVERPRPVSRRRPPTITPVAGRPFNRRRPTRAEFAQPRPGHGERPPVICRGDPYRQQENRCRQEPVVKPTHHIHECYHKPETIATGTLPPKDRRAQLDAATMIRGRGAVTGHHEINVAQGDRLQVLFRMPGWPSTNSLSALFPKAPS